MSANPFMPMVERLEEKARAAETVKVSGRVVEVVGTVVKAHVPQVEVGEICTMRSASGEMIAEGEVVGFMGNAALLTLYGDMVGVSGQTRVEATGRAQNVGVGQGLLGRVLDGMGRPLDEASRGALACETEYPIQAAAPDPLKRQLIEKPLSVGVRALDGLLTCGEGQRMGIFAAAGVGKSTLMSSLVLGAEVDVVVIALIGERGREVREFIEHNLGEEGMRRSVVVVATSDKSSMERARSAYVATAVAEYFRDQGNKVLLLMDSVTRFARALREIGLAAGEPPARRGFPPSVFAALPRLLERAGQGERGSITAFYTVLVEGDDMNEPVADETRSILDGHIVLSRELAAAGHYPAVDVLASASRVMGNITDEEHQQAVNKVRGWLATYREAELLIRIGEYQAGADASVDQAIAMREPLDEFLRQGTRDKASYVETVKTLQDLASHG